MVLLAGEAGIGKSRTIQSFCAQLESSAHARVRYQCSPHHLSSALYPVITELELAAGFAPSDGATEKLDKLRAVLGDGVGDDALALSVLAVLLSIDADVQGPALQLSPQERKAKTFDALLDRVRAAAAVMPVLIVIEDVHWSDPTTAELIGLCAARVAELPVLMVVTTRPTFDSPWAHYPHGTTLSLGRLTRRQSEDLVASVCADRPLPGSVVHEIVEKTDGIPLYIEELTKSVLEVGAMPLEPAAMGAPGATPAFTIPSSLHDSLMARLDRLESVKEVAQIGAVIGREFSYSVLAAACELDDAALQASLRQLVESQLLFQRGEPPEATYSFKHALVQDAAYESLLRSRRQQVHGRIARAIEEQFPQQAEAQPEVLARHSAAAGLTERAVHFWHAAASRAMERSGYVEAIASLDAALGALAELPAGRERDRRELELQVMKLGPLLPVKGYAAPECDVTSTRAVDLFNRVGGDEEMLFAALYVRWVGNYIRSDQAQSLALSRQYLERALATNADAPTIVGHRIHSVALLMRGDARTARDHARTALRRYEPDRHLPLIARFGQDLKVQATNYLALSEALLGDLDAAQRVAREGLAHTRSVNHLNSLVYGVWHLLVWLPAVLRDELTLGQGVEEVMALSREHNLAFWEAITPPFLMATGTPALSEIRHAEAAIAAYRQRFNMEFLVCEHLCHVGWAYLRHDAPGEALRVVDEALSTAARTGEVYWESEAMRVKGLVEAHGRSADSDAADGWLWRAIACARGRGLGLLELRAATDLARLWGEAGKRDDARGLLAPVVEAFAAGPVSRDVSDAQAVLDRLR